VRSIGVASAAAALAVGVAGNAFACSISDFSATTACGNGVGSIVVNDHDTSQTKATITVFKRLGSGQETQVGEGTISPDRSGVGSLSVPEDWAPGTTYRVHVEAGPVHEDIKPLLVTPDQACATPVPPVESSPATPTPSDTPSASATPSDSASPTQSAPGSAPSATPTTSASSPAAAVADTNAPSPAAGGSSNLAETGGGSNTGMIAGIAAVLVALGGGTVFMMRRRKPAAHN
jgi:LPXTG-motif cell wall-anchored protein